jgi:L-ribulokinase
MQIYADVTGCTMYIASSSQACALGSAISATVLAGREKGGYDDFHSAQQAMTSLKPISYDPKPENQAIDHQLYALYLQLHDAFGGTSKCANLSGVMKELILIKEAQTR